MNELQKEVLEIMRFIHHKCSEEHLTYFLAYGTLLGAVRHKGFIPWDDDIDLWMPRRDYMRFLEILRSDDDEKFGLSQGKYKPEGDRPEVLQMRVIDKKTKIARNYSEGNVIVSYPWIDIFALDQYPKKKEKKYIRDFKRELFMYKVSRAKHFLIRQKSFFGMMNSVVYYFNSKFGLLNKYLNEEKFVDKAYRALTKYEDKEIEGDGFFCYAAVYMPHIAKCIFNKEWFHRIEYEFEGEKLWGPSASDALLTCIYNDYMTLPPIEKQVNTHKAHIIEQWTEEK